MELKLVISLSVRVIYCGRVNNTSLFTSSVTLITSPESKLGVWLDRIRINGLLVGLGDDYPI